MISTRFVNGFQIDRLTLVQMRALGDKLFMIKFGNIPEKVSFL
jgi:hypothetical protein